MIKKRWLAAVVGAALMAGGLFAVPTAPPAQAEAFPPSCTNYPYRAPGWVAAENANAGTANWLVTDYAYDKNDGTQGFLDRSSAICGDTVNAYISTAASTYTVKAYRLGYYGGVKARLIWTSSVRTGVNQANPSITAYPENKIYASWTPALTIPIDVSWPPGSYVLRIQPSSGTGSYIPLVIRDDGSTSDILMQSSTMTFQAYNQWGGYSLYRGNYDNPPSQVATRSRKVTWQRPYWGKPDTAHPYQGSYGDGLVIKEELPLISYMEEYGMDVSYWTDQDLDARPQLLANHHVLALTAHDEYWTQGMRDVLEQYTAAGLNLVNFGANTGYWRSRMDAAGRNYETWRYASEDPVKSPPEAVTFRFRETTTPGFAESKLLGGMYQCVFGAYGDTSAGHLDGPVVNPGSPSWVMQGYPTLSTIPGVVAQEVDGYYNNAAYKPTSMTGVEILAHRQYDCGPDYGTNVTWDLTYYNDPTSGAGVINVGTLGWMCTLAAECDWAVAGSTKSYVRQVTYNILNQFKQGVPPANKRAMANTANFTWVR